jgi:hypothetical protein
MAPPTAFVPPTYDLRVLGPGPGRMGRLDALADEYLALAERVVGRAFARVPAFAAAAAAETGREAEWYRATTKERYLVELLAGIVMGRQFWPAFVARRDTVLILPDCLRLDPEGCQREDDPGGARCTRCHPECRVAELTEVGERYGAQAHFSVRERAGQFKVLLARHAELSVLGVACVWMLASGMRAAEEARIPSQGVLLDYCACDHWTDAPEPTDTVVARVEELLRAKAAARRR